MIFFKNIKIPDLNKKQIEKLSDISSDLGLVCISSVAIPAILERANFLGVIPGVFLAIFFWAVSILLRR